MLFVQESFESSIVEFNKIPCIVSFLYINRVATHNIAIANFIGSYSQFKLIFELCSNISSSVPYYTVNSIV